MKLEQSDTALTQKGGEATAETSAWSKRSPGATADTRAAATNPSWSNSCIQQWQLLSSGVHHVEVRESANASALAVSLVLRRPPALAGHRRQCLRYRRQQRRHWLLTCGFELGVTC